MFDARILATLAFAAVVLGPTAGPAAPIASPAGGPVGTAVAAAHPLGGLGGTLVNYTSTVDGWNLSYLEYLPANFTPGGAYPLAVYLHGIGNSTGWVDGGTNDWLTQIANATPTGLAERGLVQNASRTGFILIVPYTRSQAGFFVDSPCGGPQQHDLLDAIASASANRTITGLYLIGFSMGSAGALALAAHDPGTVAGVALAGTASDVYQLYAYNTHGMGAPVGGPASLMDQDNCGVAPSVTNATVDAAFYSYLSPLRFTPTAFAHLRIWASAGGRDPFAPDSTRFWYYLQANNTFVNATCRTATDLGEPANCTVPLWELDAQSPGTYPVRFVFEPDASHIASQFDPADVFSFFTGSVGPGFFTADFPPTALTAVPSPTDTGPHFAIQGPTGTVESGQSTNFSAVNVTGGSGPYTVDWAFGDGGTAVGTTVTHAFPAAGNVTIVATVTDASLLSNSSSFSLSLIAGLSVAWISGGPGEAGVNYTFVGVVQNGVLPYSVAWSFGDGSVAQGASVVHAYALPGNYTATVTATDALGARASSSLLAVIAPRLAIAFPTGPTPGEAGVVLPLPVVVSGGIGPILFAWDFGDGHQSSSDAHAYGATGSYAVTVRAVDALGVAATASTTVNVVPSLAVNVTSTVPAGDVGLPLPFNGSWSGGIGPFVATWAFGDGATVTGGSVEHAFGAPGTWTATFDVDDVLGVERQATVTVLVAPLPSVSIGTSPGSIDAGVPIPFDATVTGGTGAIVVNWSFGDDQAASGLSVHHTFLRAGSFNVTASVSDAVGGTNRSFVVLDVGPPPAAASTLPLVEVASILGATAIVALVIVLYVRRAGHRRPPPRE